MLANIPRFETMNKNRRVPSSLFKASFIASLAAIPPRSGRTLIVGVTHRKPRHARVLPSTRGRCRWSAARWMIASIRYERNQLKKRLTVPQQENILRDKDSRPRNANQKDGGVGILLHSVWAVFNTLWICMRKGYHHAKVSVDYITALVHERVCAFPAIISIY